PETSQKSRDEAEKEIAIVGHRISPSQGHVKFLCFEAGIFMGWQRETRSPPGVPLQEPRQFVIPAKRSASRNPVRWRG
ncbi:MAG: hypothetical protein ACRD2L_16680, partial [Terriglobia bacterium]